MNQKSKTMIYIAAFALFIGIAVLGYNYINFHYLPESPPLNTPKTSPNPQSTQEQVSTNIAPDFIVLDEDGDEVRLSSKFGKPIVLNFWASWCPPCKNEFPYFQTAYDSLKDDVEFMMVDLVDGQRETIAKGKAFIADNNYTLPVYFDTTQEAGYIYRISSIPMTCFIDKDGNLVDTYTGQIPEKILMEKIDRIIAN